MITPSEAVEIYCIKCKAATLIAVSATIAALRI